MQMTYKTLAKMLLISLVLMGGCGSDSSSSSSSGAAISGIQPGGNISPVPPPS
jgi:hypothetical protein